MRVLFYEDPLTDYNHFSWRLGHVLVDSPTYRNLKASGVDCRVILNTQADALFGDRAGIEAADRIVVRESDVSGVLGHPQDRVNDLFHDACFYDGAQAKGRTGEEAAPGTDANITRDARTRRLTRALGADASRRLETFYGSALPSDFSPDVIISWVPVPFLRSLFPDALILHKESGLFSRAPYPVTQYLDPSGYHAHGWIGRFPEQCRTDSSRARDALDRLRDRFLPLLDEKSPFGFLEDRRRDFESLTLVATQFNNFFLFDRATRHRSQMDLVIEALETTPPSQGVVVGQHPGHRKLTDFEEAYLREHYPNVILDPRFNQYEGASQFLVRHCDEVVTVSSSIGWQALFQGKRLRPIGDSHLSRFAASPGAQEPAVVDEHVAWLAFHYSFPDSLLARPDFARDYLVGKIAGKGDGNYFAEPVLDPLEMADEILGGIDESIPHAA